MLFYVKIKIDLFLTTKESSPSMSAANEKNADSNVSNAEQFALPHESILRGEIERVVFENSENGFAILRIKGDDKKIHTIVGSIFGASPGQHIEAAGTFEEHAEFGRQLRARHFRFVLPGTKEGICRYLSSGIIPGVGRKTAEKIIDVFGRRTLEVLNTDISRLSEVEGLGKKKCAAIAEGWENHAIRREGYIFLQGLGISPAGCAKLYKRYGDSAALAVKNNPYRLADDINGIGFARADAIAMQLGIARDAPERLVAGVIYQMNQNIASGHCCVPRSMLLEQAVHLLALPEGKVEEGINLALTAKRLIGENDYIYTARLYRMEYELPLHLQRLLKSEKFPAAKMEKIPPSPDITLNSQQLNAVDQVAQSVLSIITGGPGVGKTTVVGEIVRRAKKANLRIMLAAPTGRAAKRLSESTNLPAKTIHRLLQYDAMSGKFKQNYDDQLATDLLIVDEVSMVDLPLALYLFRAIPCGCAVVLVGDIDQLPSVGPGKILEDFIGSEFFVTTRLTQVFRQAADSGIIANAHRVNHGEMPRQTELNGDDVSDFYWISQEDGERAAELIVKMVAERIPKRFNFNPLEDIQVLTPMHRGSCGTSQLNSMLQEALNGGQTELIRYGDRSLKLGDRVMQTSNNYEKNVFNGDQGRIVFINHKERKLQVLFDGERTVEFTPDELEQLVLAYAVTVHKSQGCEFPVVIVPLLTQHFMMLQRNLLYTAMTRARQLLIIIGSPRALSMAVENFRREERFSMLGERLRNVYNQLIKN